MASFNVLFALVFFAVWATLMGSYLFFNLRVAPAALERWAKEQGVQIVEKRMAGPLDWWSYAKGSGHQIYRLVVVDKMKETRSGLARVGMPNWFCLSSGRCPVEARWDPPGKLRPHNQPVTRRTVLCFVVADFVAATVLLAVLLILLFMVALCVDDLWNGALGLNDRIGRVPRRTARAETQWFMTQLSGLLALDFAAVMLLLGAGFGMMRGKLWGYYSHVAGLALVVFVPGGFLFAIPALAISLRPAFKAHFRASEKPKPTLDSLAEL
jgi:hypothetical protein